MTDSERRLLKSMLGIIEEGVHRGGPVSGPFMVIPPMEARLMRPSDPIEAVKVYALPWDHSSIKTFFRAISDETRRRYGRAHEYESQRIKELDFENRTLFAENKALKDRLQKAVKMLKKLDRVLEMPELCSLIDDLERESGA